MVTNYNLAADLLKLSQRMTPTEIERAAKIIVKDFGKETKSLLKALKTKLELEKTNLIVLSARDLTARQKGYITKTLESEKANIAFEIDQSLVGGIIIKKGDTIIDNSLSSKLSDMKNILSNTIIKPRS